MREGRYLGRNLDLAGVRRSEKGRDFVGKEKVGWKDCGKRNRDRGKRGRLGNGQLVLLVFAWRLRFWVFCGLASGIHFQGFLEEDKLTLCPFS